MVFLEGLGGLKRGVEFLESLRDMLTGNVNSKVGITTKWDGAPAIFCGVNPDSGKFFVATKGAFAQNPKLCYANSDIDGYYPLPSGLNKKLKLALLYLPDLGITNVLQGDMMYSEGDVSTETIDGERYVTFRPNTITYAIPAGSDLAKRILTSKLGVVFHTTYRGRPFASMQASFGANLSSLRTSKNVWYRDAAFVDASGVATFTRSESTDITRTIASIAALTRQLSAGVVNKIAANEMFRMPIMTWNNSKIRKGEEIKNIKKHIADFIADQDAKMAQNIIDAKKADTKQKRTRERIEVIKFWKDKQTQRNLLSVYEIYNLIIEAKLVLVRKLEQVHDVGTFLKTPSGYKVTKAEGFVAIDHIGGGAIKLVDRLSFSFHNFNTTKDWAK